MNFSTPCCKKALDHRRCCRLPRKKKTPLVLVDKRRFFYGAPGGIRTRHHAACRYGSPLCRRVMLGKSLRNLRSSNPWRYTKKKRTACGDALLFGAPGGIRTLDLLVRSQALYPTELRALLFCSSIIAHFICLVNPYSATYSAKKSTFLKKILGIFRPFFKKLWKYQKNMV